MLSQKAKYAIKALLVLARTQDSHLLVQARDISESENIPKKFLDLIFFELRRHGLIVSTRRTRRRLCAGAARGRNLHRRDRAGG
jgi:DNA-binding IscR family transcriptional regulator